MNSFRTRFFAACLMGLYALIGTPVACVVFVVVAQCSDEHELQVHGMEGGFRVVLHHRHAEVTPRPHDHKQGVAKVLTCLCGLNPEGDHVFVSAAPPTSLSQKADRSHLRGMPMPVPAIPAWVPVFQQVRVNTEESKVRWVRHLTHGRSNRPRAAMGTIALLV